MPNFAGTWKMKSSENFDELLKALGKERAGRASARRRQPGHGLGAAPAGQGRSPLPPGS